MILPGKNIRDFSVSESALSEIIASIMLLAIVVAVIALIQAQSVPEWNKDVEADHFNVVYDDFLRIRSDIEDVALFQFPKSSVIHMGAHYPDRLIFINPADTSGTLTSDGVWMNVSYNDPNNNYTYYNFSSTFIKFDPNYNYLINSPSLAYEHGIVIKDFTNNNYVYTDTDQGIFSSNMINAIILDYPRASMSFSGINTMSYSLKSRNSTGNNTNVTVAFYTFYPDLWKKLLEKFNLTYIGTSSRNIIKFGYPGNITINTYIVDGSLASGTGVSIVTVPAPVRDLIFANITVLSRSAPKGTNATYSLNLTNNGTDTDSFILSVSNPDLASLAVLNISSPIILNAGESRIFTLNVTNTSAGGPFRVNVTAASVNDTSKFGYINTTTTVTPVVIRSVSLTNITVLSVSATKGTNATYSLNLTNNGTDPDSYSLSVSNPDLASLAVLNISSPVFLNAGQSRIFTLNVTNTSAGGPFRVNVTAASVNDTAKFGYINTTTFVLPLTVTAYLRNTNNPAGEHIWDISATPGVSQDTTTYIQMSEYDNVYYVFNPGHSRSSTGTPGSSSTGYGWAGEIPVNGTIGGNWSFRVKTIKSSIDSGESGRILVYVYRYNSSTGSATYMFNLTGSANHLGTTSATSEVINGTTQYYAFSSSEYILVEYWLKVINADHSKNVQFEVNTDSDFVTYLQK